MDAKAAIELLREVGIYRLCGTEGCLCMSCEIQGISIDVSCRKSNGSRIEELPEFYGTVIRVSSHHLDSNAAELQLVADEVKAQLESNGGEFVIKITP